MTYGDVLEMEQSERRWWLGRQLKQLKRENDEMKKAAQKGKRGRRGK